ncbi:hypothetical protein C8Q79DRAFT_1120546 [Trametes meyenii]|nr:hypothetical protein C8Q79DRAFT_1120546 [Trametes meyenii]
MPTTASQFKTFIRRILHLPMSSDTALLHLLGQSDNDSRATECFSTDQFRLRYHHSCSLAFLNANAPHRELLYSARIGAVYFMKRRAGSQHEYIVVSIYGKVAGRQGPQLLGWLKCERTVSRRDNTPMNHAKACSANASTDSSSTSHSGIPALDCITVFNDGYTSLRDVVTKDSTVFSVDFLQRGRFENAPFLLNLAIAADLLTHRSPNYDLLRKQCYWFAGVLFRTIVGPQADDLPTEVEGLVPVPSDSQAQSNLVPLQDLPTGTAIGTFRTFRTYFQIVTSNEVEVEYKGLTPDYIENVKDLRTKLQGEKAQGDKPAQLEKQVKDEAQRADAATAQVKDEAQRADAAMAQAKDEAQRADAAMAQVKELQEEAQRAKEEAQRAKEEARRAKEEAQRAAVAEAARVKALEERLQAAQAHNAQQA